MPLDDSHDLTSQFQILNLNLEPDSSPSVPQRTPTGRTIKDVVSHLEVDGRTYHGWMAGEYSLPNDGEEQDRQDLQHGMCLQIMGGRLADAPVENESPTHVLDIGTGTGIWAIEFAEQHPNALVVGTDLSLIQPVPRVPNCQFVLENSETQEWLFPYLFDYIHLRAISPCFNDLSTVLRRAFDHTRPGGWVEIQDGSWQLHCIDDTTRGTALEQWFQILPVAGARAGRDMTKSAHYKQYLIQAGYVDVVEKIYPVPGSSWPRDRKLKEVGMFLQQVMLSGVDSYRKLFIGTGLSAQEVDELISNVKKDLKNRGIHWYTPFYCVYGRKPHFEETKPAGEGLE